MSTGTSNRVNSAQASRLQRAAADAASGNAAQSARRKELAKKSYTGLRKEASQHRKRTGHKPHGLSAQDLIDFIVQQEQTMSRAAHR